MRLHTITEGPEGAALTLVWLHGFLGTAEEWRPVMRALPGGIRQVALDLPGHGASLGLAPEAYTMEGVAPLVRAALDAAAPGRRCLLAGYSMGGRVALHLACAHPDWWSGLLLESASPGIADAAERAERRRRDAAWAGRLADGPLEAVLRDWYDQPLFAGLSAGERAQRIARAACQAGPELARAIRGFSPGAQTPLWSGLAGLPWPAVFCVGAEDPGYVALAARMESLCPNGRRVMVAGAGHNVHLEAPAAFVAVCGQWIETVAGRA